MNNERRKQIDAALEFIVEARGILESVRDEEQGAFDNLPESFQDSEKGERMQDAVSSLEEAIADLENIESSLEEVK